MLTTLASISEGSCIIAGHDAAKKPDDVRRSIGFVPQDTTVDGDLKGMENLLLTAKLYHVSDDLAKRRINELLDLVGLREAASRFVKTYSGGMKKRLELIAGLLHQPSILFLDEPTQGLDIQSRSAMWDYIRRINKEKNMTIFLTTHYLEEADSLCDRVAIIDNGSIKALAPPSKLKSEFGSDILEIEVAQGPSLIKFFESISGVKEVTRSNNKYRI